MELLAKFLLAHLLGDFFLQQKSWIEEKGRKKWRAPALYWHVLIHFALIVVITAGEGPYWIPAAAIALSHFVIDGLKLQLQKKENKRLWFFADQFLHLVVLLIVWALLEKPDITGAFWHAELFWVVLPGAVFLTRPASFFIGTFMSKWAPYAGEGDSESLKDAGKYIGIMERLFVFAFLLAGHWQTIGFLLAAKSIFRFGDLTRARDRKLTEYILIGTLLSFGLALLTGFVALQWIE